MARRAVSLERLSGSLAQPANTAERKLLNSCSGRLLFVVDAQTSDGSVYCKNNMNFLWCVYLARHRATAAAAANWLPGQAKRLPLNSAPTMIDDAIWPKVVAIKRRARHKQQTEVRSLTIILTQLSASRRLLACICVCLYADGPMGQAVGQPTDQRGLIGSFAPLFTFIAMFITQQCTLAASLSQLQISALLPLLDEADL